jgi:DNA-binding transcriptional MerR regulator
MARRTRTIGKVSKTTVRRGSRGETVLITRTVLCSLGGVSEAELAVWEREELVMPAEPPRRTAGEEPLYDREALHRIRVIRSLAEDLEVNLPGIGVILHLLDQLGH